MTQEADFRVRSRGTILTFEPLTTEAKDFAERAIDIQPWQWIGPAFGVDHRVANDLVTALEAEGFDLGP